MMSSNSSGSGQYGVAKAVIPPLRDGLSSFISLYDSLLSAKQRGTRELIVRAEQDMKKALEKAERGLTQLDQETETLTEQQHRSRRKQEKKTQSLEDLRTKLDGEKQALERSKEALERARRHLRDQKEELKKQQDKQAAAEVKMKVALGLAFIPFVGLVAGVPLAAVGAIDMEEAEKAIDVAEGEVEKEESRVETYSDKVSDYESKITQTERDIGRTDGDLTRIQERLSEIKSQRWALAQFQEKMRGAVRCLGRLSGSARVLKIQTRRSILLGPVMKLLEEVVRAAGGVSGHQLLKDKGVLSLVDAMRDRSRRLAALCASHNTPALQQYT